MPTSVKSKSAIMPRGLTDPKIAARIADMASTVFIAYPADFDKFVIEQTAKWRKVIQEAGIKAE